MHIRFFVTKVSPPITSCLTALVLFLITLSTPFMCFSVMYFCSYIRTTRQLDAGRYLWQNLSISFENRSHRLLALIRRATLEQFYVIMWP